MNEINFIDLFGGVGGFRLGFERASNEMELWRCGQKESELEINSTDSFIKSDKRQSAYRCVAYYDNDKYAVQVYNKNFKENHKPTDVTQLDTREIPDHDLLCAGFPCQSFSVAGKRKGFQDTRGTLFFEICRIAKKKDQCSSCWRMLKDCYHIMKGGQWKPS